MFLSKTVTIGDKVCVGVEVTTTIYSGHVGDAERKTATAKIIPIVKNEEGVNITEPELASNLMLTVDENMDPALAEDVLMVQTGIRGIINKVTLFSV